MIWNLLNRRKKLSSKNRSLRLQILTNMALRGKTYDEIYSKAMSWGRTEQTAKSYMVSILARIGTLKGKSNLVVSSGLNQS